MAYKGPRTVTTFLVFLVQGEEWGLSQHTVIRHSSVGVQKEHLRNPAQEPPHSQDNHCSHSPWQPASSIDRNTCTHSPMPRMVWGTKEAVMLNHTWGIKVFFFSHHFPLTSSGNKLWCLNYFLLFSSVGSAAPNTPTVTLCFHSARLFCYTTFNTVTQTSPDKNRYNGHQRSNSQYWFWWLHCGYITVKLHQSI